VGVIGELAPYERTGSKGVYENTLAHALGRAPVGKENRKIIKNGIKK